MHTVAFHAKSHYENHMKIYSHFDLESWVTGGTKIWPGIPNNWRIFESNWLDIESQIVNLTQIFPSQFDLSPFFSWLRKTAIRGLLNSSDNCIYFFCVFFFRYYSWKPSNLFIYILYTTIVYIWLFFIQCHCV